MLARFRNWLNARATSADRVGRNRLEQRAQRVPLRAAAGSRRFRERADAFDAIDECLAAIGRDDAAEDFAEQSHVVAQGFVEVKRESGCQAAAGIFCADWPVTVRSLRR